MSRQKREKKRKNEIKTRTIQKLQLGMTAPTDLDMNDNELAGEEMFDLGEGERELARAGGRNIAAIVGDADGLSESEEEVSAEVAESDDEAMSSDEEREVRTQMLEGALDNLYDEYKDRMADRDAKWRVKQARLKDRNFDAWHGINKDEESDDGVDKGYRDQMVRRMPRRGDADSEDEESEGEGGWDVVAAQKAELGENDSSDSDSDSDAEEGAAPKQKKKAAIKIRSDARAPAPAPSKRLLTTLTPDTTRAQMSRNAQVWYDQGVFKGAGDLAALDGDDESEEDDEEEDDDDDDDDDEMDVDEAEDSDVEMDDELSSTLGEEEEDEDDFEIVPQGKDDEPEWNVDDEDQDEVLQKQIKGGS
jgi:AdoMet-dependent rRNA methyltransferase SPB1